MASPSSRVFDLLEKLPILQLRAFQYVFGIINRNQQNGMFYCSLKALGLGLGSQKFLQDVGPMVCILLNYRLAILVRPIEIL